MMKQWVIPIVLVLSLAIFTTAMGTPVATRSSRERTIPVSIGVYDPADYHGVIEYVTENYGARIRTDIESISCASFDIKKSQLEEILRDSAVTWKAKWIYRVGKCSIPENEYPGEIFGEWEGPSSAWQPNDPYYHQQWGPPCIDAERAWNRRTGDKNVIVFIVDTGVNYNHPDLSANYDKNIDRDYVNNDYDAYDDNGHGSHCAGICSGVINNNIGIAGLFQATISSSKVLNSYGSGYWDWVASGIDWARQQGADVISMSLGGSGDDPAVEAACQSAYNQDVMVIAAAGNYGSSSKFYPAAYRSVIGVGALETCTRRASFSNYGFGDDTTEGNVEVMAPGEDIYSTYLGSSYTYMDGTSMACPHVAGVAAGYRSFRNWWSSSQIRHHMQNHADYLGTSQYYGYGRIDGWPPRD
jgi:thermitase